MTITIQPELERLLLERAKAEGLSADAYVAQLIRENVDWQDQPLSADDLDFVDIQASVQEGLAQAEANQTRPAREVFAGLRAKYGLSD
jgi:hypothetical protein